MLIRVALEPTQAEAHLALISVLRAGGDFEAANAAAAIRQLGERAFDLILCEYALGEGQDGQHLLEDLRTHHLIPLSTLFIMVTAESSYERVVSAVEFAPNDYLLKPFTADSLFQRIGRALEKRDAFMPLRPHRIGNLREAVSDAERVNYSPQYAIDFPGARWVAPRRKRPRRSIAGCWRASCTMGQTRP
jgi:DNA-binding NtrC family response regulator